MTQTRMGLSRRTWWTASALAAAGGGLWLTSSSSWAARFLRERILEIGRAAKEVSRRPSISAWNDNRVTTTWLGHATMLLNFYGVRILMDPAFSLRVGLDMWLFTFGPKRVLQPALRPQDLPEVDLVLISHAHFDHLDLPSLRSLKGKPALITARRTADLMPAKRFSSLQELGWDESAVVGTRHGDVRVQAIAVKHWGARYQRDTYRGYNGYILERNGVKILFAGDTANTPLFAGYRSRGPFDLALMPIGAYDPWIHAHCTPEQAVAMAQAAGARYLAPIHHQTFILSREPLTEPLERFQAALAREPERVAWKETGDTFVLP